MNSPVSVEGKDVNLPSFGFRVGLGTLPNSELYRSLSQQIAQVMFPKSENHLLDT